MTTQDLIRVATDVGGTFTDLVCFRIDGESGRQSVVTAKSDTTPHAFQKGVVNVIAKAGIEPEEIGHLVHGTTVVINALTERKGARVGLITTEGFKDVLEIARGNRPDFFNLAYRKPTPFVPRHLRREVAGRLDFTGRERSPLSLDGLAAIVDDFRTQGVEAIAVCLLHAYANPAHELAVLAALGELCPDLPVVASHQITREWREFERTNTTVLSAYVQPVTVRYLNSLQDEMRARGFGGRLYVMQSNCGVDSIEKTCEAPVAIVESGPASGFRGAAELGRQIGERNILALDIGGTTAKCSLIRDGQVTVVTDYWIERSALSAGYPMMVPVVDLVEIGNGGGSIASVDDFGKLHVGPESAGSTPGPAAYGRGGVNATTTDANLALGRINSAYFCGGELEADMAAVHRALGMLGEKLGMSGEDVARGIIRIANQNMVNALKLVSLNRGHDPREFSLVAFGGGGAMHAVALASELGMRRVVIPRAAAVFSAYGMITSDFRRDYFVTRLMALDDSAAHAIAGAVGEIEQPAIARFEAEGIQRDRISFERLVRLRYRNQEHSVEVPLTSGLVDTDAITAAIGLFHELYEREYTYRLDADVELVSIHVIATAAIDKPGLSRLPVTGKRLGDAKKGVRPVDYAEEGVHEAGIYDGEALEPGMTFEGPAIIESKGTTTVVHPGNRVTVDPYGNFLIDLNPEAN
ncbi:hydantoinase/oxoprolinase family protein [Burkholderia sp. PU8-34]